MPKIGKAVCEGSHTDPVEITEEPEQYRDRWNNICGPPGRGICGSCTREVGLTTQQKITRHNALEQDG